MGPLPTGTAHASGPPTPLVITPSGAGAKDGLSWASAAPLSSLPKLVKRLPGGGEIWIRSDAGPYLVTSPLILTAGGIAGAPVVIRGVDGQGRPSAPTIAGTRAAPYSPTGATGSDAFRLALGANHLVFRNLALINHGNGAFRIGADILDLTIEDVRATNVTRFVENDVTGGATSASIDGLILRRIVVAGFSRSVARLQYRSRNVVLEDVAGDSQRQESEHFAMGVHLEGQVSDVVLRRVRMDNSFSRLGSYWNGDGFATERGVTRVLFEDTSASGSTDGGYDLKSTSTTLLRARAHDNKRNFRFWAADTNVKDCVGTSPLRRGGIGSQAQVWLAEDAGVDMSGCAFRDDSAGSVVFELEDRAYLAVTGGTITRSPESRLQVLHEGSELSFSPSPSSDAPSEASSPTLTPLPSPVRSLAQPRHRHWPGPVGRGMTMRRAALLGIASTATPSTR